MLSPANGSAKPIAIIWVHGNGVNFYSPTYLTIARELAMRGLTTITVNTRMHDLGNVAGYHGETRIRGGSYWGVTSEQVRDLAGWIDFAKQRGFARVVLVGHSAGATAVQLYGAQRQDDRVAGIVLASGRFRPGTAPVDSARLKEAARLVAEGHGEDAVPTASRPTVTSAATLLDLANMGVLLTDFYGVDAKDPPVTRLRCPILAWFGTRGDVGTAADLELLVPTLKRHSGGPSTVTTALIQNAEHVRRRGSAGRADARHMGGRCRGEEAVKPGACMSCAPMRRPSSRAAALAVETYHCSPLPQRMNALRPAPAS